MAARTLSITTPTLTGASISSVDTVLASSDTCTISCTTAQSAIDFSTGFIRAVNANSTTSVVLTIGAGSRYSGIGVGTASVTVGTETSVIIGGQGFESARFLNTAGTIVITSAGTGPVSLEMYQVPRVQE